MNYYKLTILSILLPLLCCAEGVAEVKQPTEILGISIGDDIAAALRVIREKNPKAYVAPVSATIFDGKTDYKSDPKNPFISGYEIQNYKNPRDYKDYEETIYLVNDLHASKNDKVLAIARKVFWPHGRTLTQNIHYKNVKESLLQKYGEPDYMKISLDRKTKMENGCNLLWGAKPISAKLKNNPKAVVDSGFAAVRNTVKGGPENYMEKYNASMHTEMPFLGCELYQSQGKKDMIGRLRCVLLDPELFQKSRENFRQQIESGKRRAKKKMSSGAAKNSIDL